MDTSCQITDVAIYASRLPAGKFDLDILPTARRIDAVVYGPSSGVTSGPAGLALLQRVMCVQGCSQQAGVDYDQTWSGTLRHATHTAHDVPPTRESKWCILVGSTLTLALVVGRRVSGAGLR